MTEKYPNADIPKVECQFRQYADERYFDQAVFWDDGPLSATRQACLVAFADTQSCGNPILQYTIITPIHGPNQTCRGGRLTDLRLPLNITEQHVHSALQNPSTLNIRILVGC